MAKDSFYYVCKKSPSQYFQFSILQTLLATGHGEGKGYTLTGVTRYNNIIEQGKMFCENRYLECSYTRSNANTGKSFFQENN